MEKLIKVYDMSPESLMQMFRNLLKDEIKKLIKESKVSETDCFLTRNEAAEFLKISKTTLWSLDKSQILPAKRLSGKVLYRKSDLLNFSNIK